MHPIDRRQPMNAGCGTIEALFYRWFVEYNPLYFASALFFVFGVFLVSKGLGQINWLDGQLLLTAVIEGYEVLLLCGSFILYRIAGLRRPAVILAIINICFLFDCTYQTEHISANPDFGIIATVLWILAFGVKLVAMAWIFRLRVSWFAYAIPVLAAIGIAVGPHLLYSNAVDKSLIHLGATWYGVLLTIAYLLLRPAAACEKAPDPRCRIVLAKVWNAAWIIWGGLYLFHTISWLRFFDIAINPANLAPIFAILPFLWKKEEYGWVGITLLLVFSLASPSCFSVAALLGALILFLCGTTGRHPRLYVGTIICLHLALRTVGWQEFPLPGPNQFLVVLTGVALLLVGWAYRLMSAFLVATLGGVAYFHLPAPRNILQWGALFIAAGFASLFAGVAASWWFRYVSPEANQPANKGG